MKQFEYAQTELKAGAGQGPLTIKQIQEHLTAVGSDGWELAAQFRHNREHIEFTFKREIDETESVEDESQSSSQFRTPDMKMSWPFLRDPNPGSFPFGDYTVDLVFTPDDPASLAWRALCELELLEEAARLENRKQRRERVIEALLRERGPMKLVDILRYCHADTFDDIEAVIGDLLVDRVITHAVWNDKYQQGNQGYKLTVGAGGPVVRRRLKQPAAETVVRGKPEFFGRSEPVHIEVVVNGRPVEEAPAYWRSLAEDRFDGRPVVGMHAEKEQGGGWVLVVYHE